MQLAGVTIGAEDVRAVADAYAVVLGCPSTPHPAGQRFQLARGAVTIIPGLPGLRAIQFSGSGVPVVPGLQIETVPSLPPGTRSAASAIDHIVIRSTAPDRAIALWRDHGGLRLALDRTFPERGLQLLFFRSGGMTLEYAIPHPLPDGPPADDVLWGLSYRVRDLPADRARLHAAGVDVSEIRKGMRPASIVCTVRSHTAGVPTLLLQETGPTVREAIASDRDVIEALWSEVFPEARAWNTAGAILTRRAATPPDLVLVAERDDRILGAVMLGWDGHRGWIYHLAVRPDARRAGVGTTLMRQAERVLREHGCPKVNLQIIDGNDAVVGFYERLGYVVEPRTSMGKTLA